MPYQDIRYEVAGPIGRIILNRPKTLNALNTRLMEEFTTALGEAETDDTVRGVIISGEGRVFSAGYDLNEVAEEGEMSSVKWHQRLRQNVSAIMKIWELPKPVIAAVHSYCLAGACELVMTCDLTIAADDALFGEPEVRHRTGPVALIMPWIIGLKKTKELLFTGDLIDAEQALRFGMVNRVVSRGDLEEETEKLALKVARVPATVMRLTKMPINKTYEIMGLLAALLANVDFSSILHAAEEPIQIEFTKIVRERGLKTALEWGEGLYNK
jgi:enoyl-CoA hydratase/carnithine racemase